MRALILGILFISLTASAVVQRFDAIKVGDKSAMQSSAITQIDSVIKGFLMPRMTTTQRLAIASPIDGLLVYDTNLKTVVEYNTSLGAWTFLVASSGGSVLNPSIAVVTDSSGNLTSSTTTATEVGYLSSSGVTAGGVLYGNGSRYKVTSVGSTGQFLISNGASAPTWSSTFTGSASLNVLKAGDTSTGTQNVFVGTDIVGRVTKGFSAGTADLEQWDNNAGTVLAKIDKSGNVTATSFTGTVAGTNVSGNISGNAANVTGTVAIGSGGTGQTTKAPAFDALQPMTTSGDIIYGGASGTGTRLAVGTTGQVLTLAAGIPSWATAAATDSTKVLKAGDTMTSTLNNFVSTDVVGRVTKGASAGTADLEQWDNNAGTVLSKIDKSGNHTAPSFILAGATTGTLTMSPAASTTSYSLSWPSAQGSASTYPRNDGSGNLTWVTGTSNPGTSGSSEFINRAQIAGDGSCTISSQSGSWLSSASHSATGACTLTVAAGVFSAAPTCGCSTHPAAAGNALMCGNYGTNSSTSVKFTTDFASSTGGASTAFDTAFDVWCMGPH